MNKIFLPLVVCACGVMPSPVDAGSVITIDESKCSRDVLEGDGLASSEVMTLDAGTYVVSSTYLRIKPTEEAGALFQSVNKDMGAALKANPGLIQAVTRLSVECNTARTLTVWRDEAAMLEFVGSTPHAHAMGEVRNISRGGSLVTHWTDTGNGFTWTTALQKLKEDPGPFY